MNNKSISSNPTRSGVCVIFSIITIFSIVGLPTRDIHKNIYPVTKGPRPYKANITGLNNLNDEPNYQISKKESLFYPIIIKAADKHKTTMLNIIIIVFIKNPFTYQPLFSLLF